MNPVCRFQGTNRVFIWVVSGFFPANLKASLKLLSCLRSLLALNDTFSIVAIDFYRYSLEAVDLTYFMRSSITFCYSLKYSELFRRSGMCA